MSRSAPSMATVSNSGPSPLSMTMPHASTSLGLARAADGAQIAGAAPDPDPRVGGQRFAADPLDLLGDVAGVAEVAVDQLVVLGQHPEQAGRPHRRQDPELFGRLGELADPELRVGLVGRARDVRRAERIGCGRFDRHRTRHHDRDQVLGAEDRPAASAPERAPLVVHDRGDPGEPAAGRADGHDTHALAVAGLERVGHRLDIVEVDVRRERRTSPRRRR